MKTNIVLIGLSGAGKTTIGNHLSSTLSMPFVDSDESIEKDYGKINDLFDKGEAYFRNIESKTIAKLALLDDIILATGGGVILYPKNIEALHQKGIIFYIKRSVEDILSSIDASGRPLVRGNPINNLQRLHDERSHLYEKSCDYVIDATHMEKAIGSIISIWSKKS